MKFLLCAAAFALAGCASQQESRLQHTTSGQPEAVYPGLNVEQVRDRIVGACMTAAMQVQAESNDVTCAKTMTGGQAITAQLLIGSGYSTTPAQVVRFNIATTGNAVRVVAWPSIETQMAFGQMRRVPLTGASDFNEVQRMLWTLR